MKLSLLPKQKYFLHTNSFSSTPENSSNSSSINQNTSKYTNFLFTILYGISCLFSLILGFRFSRVVFFLLFSTPNTLYTTTTSTTASTTLTLSLNQTQRPVIVGRHGISIRDCPHPNPEETLHAHQIVERVQKEQRMQYRVKESRQIIAVTTTYVRSFQRAYMNGLIHSLMLVPYDLTWIVVEAGGLSNETRSILDGSHINFVHVGFNETGSKQRMDNGMRVHALRLIKERKMDGIVMFADDSNIHSMELFDEIQKVEWLGSFSIGVLDFNVTDHNRKGEEEEVAIPVQGPTCTASNKLVSFPTKQEWSAFAMNSKLLWDDVDGKPEWARDVDDFFVDGKEIESPLDFFQDASFVEPLGDCGKTVMLWWLRAEARADRKK